MKILVVMPAPRGTTPPEHERRTEEIARSYSSVNVEIIVGYPEQSGGFVPQGGDTGALNMTRNHLIIAERMIQAEAEGMDACIPWGMMEFGVDLARGRCAIPIVGQARAAYCTAALMVDRFGVITYRTEHHHSTWRQLRDQGFLGQVSGLGAVNMPTPQMAKEPELLFERFAAEGKRLVAEGAELIVCHGMSMSPGRFSANELSEGVGVPVLEGMGCAVAQAQAWHRLGTPYSPVRYR